MASSSAQTPKPDSKAGDKQPEQAAAATQQKTAAALEEDDEFEDFPVDGLLLPSLPLLSSRPSVVLSLLGGGQNPMMCHFHWEFEKHSEKQRVNG